MINNDKVFEEVRVMHKAGVLVDYACQETTIPQEDAVLLARFALDQMGLDKGQENSVCSMKWLSVSECLPELDTPVFGGWFCDNGDFIWDCYVRTIFTNSDGWVWAVAEHFGEGEWLFDDDHPVKYWMPLPGKPELVGGAA